jgi:hypothetical protein
VQDTNRVKWPDSSYITDKNWDVKINEYASAGAKTGDKHQVQRAGGEKKLFFQTALAAHGRFS